MPNIGEFWGCEIVLETSMELVWTVKGEFCFCCFFFPHPKLPIIRVTSYTSFYSSDGKAVSVMNIKSLLQSVGFGVASARTL